MDKLNAKLMWLVHAIFVPIVMKYHTNWHEWGLFNNIGMYFEIFLNVYLENNGNVFAETFATLESELFC